MQKALLTRMVQLCVQKLRIFIEDSDQNLKYLGLQAMAQVLPCPFPCSIRYQRHDDVTVCRCSRSSPRPCCHTATS